jgi:hypothetical protein
MSKAAKFDCKLILFQNCLINLGAFILVYISYIENVENIIYFWPQMSLHALVIGVGHLDYIAFQIFGMEKAIAKITFQKFRNFS